MSIIFNSRILFLNNISSRKSWFVCIAMCGLEIGLCMHFISDSVEFIPMSAIIIECATLFLGCAVWEQIYESVSNTLTYEIRHYTPSLIKI